MEYVYPARFHPNEDGSITITYPDLPGCISEGKSLGNALFMAHDALSQWLDYLTDKGRTIPPASHLEEITPEKGEFINLVRAVVQDKAAVRRNISIPKWMDDQARQNGISLSRVLQDALRERLAAT